MSKYIPLYVLARTPDNDAEKVEWVEICHNKHDFIVVSHTRTRYNDRGQSFATKRPFTVEIRSYSPNRYCPMFRWSTHYTFEAAMKEAVKVQKSRAAQAVAA